MSSGFWGRWGRGEGGNGGREEGRKSGGNEDCALHMRTPLGKRNDTAMM